jgi:hypothetical protein
MRFGRKDNAFFRTYGKSGSEINYLHKKRAPTPPLRGFLIRNRGKDSAEIQKIAEKIPQF